MFTEKLVDTNNFYETINFKIVTKGGPMLKVHGVYETITLCVK